MGVLLVINDYGKGLREVSVSRDEIVIGRDPAAEIVLEDTGVSRAHARIVRTGLELLLEDLGSRNGTTVNERRLLAGEPLTLCDGDTIRLGRSFILFLQKITAALAGDAAAAKATQAVEETQTSRAPLCLFTVQKLDPRLIVVRKRGDASCHLLKSDRVRIGRSPASDVVLCHATVSDDHAEIVYNTQGFYLVDRDSAHGTFLDGVSVRVSRMEHRSFVRFGKVRTLFVVHEAGKDPPEASFSLRDHLVEIYPERVEALQRAFRDCREGALDFAEELVTRGILDPEEWWAAGLSLQGEKLGPASRWPFRLFHRRPRKG